jgi:hypothetical protein
MLKPTKEDNDATLLATENRLFDCLFDAMKDQSQAMYAFMDQVSPHSKKPTIQETPEDDKISSTTPHSNEPIIQEFHHLSNSCDNTQPLHNSLTYTTSTHPHSNEPNMQETPDGDEISSTPPNYQLSKNIQMAPKSASPLLIRMNYLSKRLQMAMK